MDVLYVGPRGVSTTLQGVETDQTSAFDHVKRILKDTKGHIFKIGIATNPVLRSYGHNKVVVDEKEVGDMTYVTLQRGMWSTMHVVFQTTSEPAIRLAEREFIRKAAQNFGDFAKSNLVTMNASAGGEGPLGAQGPYFLYVLRSFG